MDIAEIKELNKNNKKDKNVTRAVTLPYWLNEAAKQSDINVSHVLREALKKELNIEDPEKKHSTQK